MKARESGSLLIFVSWVLVLLTVFSLAVGYRARQKLDLIQRLEEREKLRLISDAAVKKAVHVISIKSSGKTVAADSLKDAWSHSPSDFRDIPLGDGRFTVTGVSGPGLEERYGLVDEESKMNLNHVKSPALLGRLLEKGAGLKSEEAQDLAASIIDWRDNDDFTHAGGAEASYYRALKPPYAPKNADFQTLQELLFVKGMTPAILKRIRPLVTVDGDGKINVNTGRPVQFAAHGIGIATIRKIDAFRKGLDGKWGTKDDPVFTSTATFVEDLASVQPMDPDEKSDLQAVVDLDAFGVESKNFTINVISRLNHRKMELQRSCVVGESRNVKSCREVFRVAEPETGAKAVAGLLQT